MTVLLTLVLTLEGTVQTLEGLLDKDVGLGVRFHGVTDITELPFERLLSRTHDHVPLQVRTDLNLVLQSHHCKGVSLVCECRCTVSWIELRLA